MPVAPNPPELEADKLSQGEKLDDGRRLLEPGESYLSDKDYRTVVERDRVILDWALEQRAILQEVCE